MRYFVLALIFAIVGLSPAQAQTSQQFTRAALTIESSTKKHQFTVELALTSEQREQGLRFRKSLAPDAGMLFVFDNLDDPLIMWMADTSFSLDFLFIEQNGRIGETEERAVPNSTKWISPIDDYFFVLALKGGTAEHLGIKLGDRVISSALRANRTK